MKEYREESQVFVLMRFLSQHPALVFSISYVLLTLCGILYSYSFYKDFNIAILKLANISDLLIAGLSEPAALLMFSGAVVTAFIFDFTTQKFYRIQEKLREKPKSLLRTIGLVIFYIPRRSESVMLMAIGSFVFYGYIFVAFYADWHSERIREGHGDKIVVTSADLGLRDKTFTLLGSTTNFVFVYSVSDVKAIAIPIDNLQTISASKSVE